VNVTGMSGSGLDGLYVKLPDTCGLTVTVFDACAVLPAESVTVTVTE